MPGAKEKNRKPCLGDHPRPCLCVLFWLVMTVFFCYNKTVNVKYDSFPGSLSHSSKLMDLMGW